VKNIFSNQGPLIAWAVLIFWLSSLSHVPRIDTPILASDKIAHALVYFVLCWFSSRAVYRQRVIAVLAGHSLLAGFVFTCVYGYFDEVHQLFVPGRNYDYFDMLADASGALIFVLLAQAWKFLAVRRAGRG